MKAVEDGLVQNPDNTVLIEYQNKLDEEMVESKIFPMDPGTR